MARKKTALILLSLLTLAPAFAQDRTLVLGAEDDWSRLARQDSVVPELGVRGSLDLVLADRSPDLGTDVDLYLPFNSDFTLVEEGDYRAGSGAVRIRPEARLGTGAAYFHPISDPLVLEAGPLALFSPGSSWGSFSIEFHLNPTLVREGEVILHRQGTAEVAGTFVDQEFRVEIRNGRLRWVFLNMFRAGGQDGTRLLPDLILQGRSRLIPNRWSRHLLRFDERTGLLEYLAEGVPEALTHANPSGREQTQVYYPFLGSLSDPFLELAPDYVGFIDELLITRGTRDDGTDATLPSRPGIAETVVLDLGTPGTELLAVTPSARRPDTSELLVAYRLGEHRFDGGGTEPPWTYLRDDALPRGGPRTGRYLQLRFELYAGGDFRESPRLADVSVTYRPNLPPAAPPRVVVTPYDGAVGLNWSPVPESDVAGYLIYYRRADGQFYGRDADAGSSPIDVGNRTSFVVEGLENGVLYYFAVSAYDISSSRGDLFLSRDEPARPLGLYDEPP